MVFGIPFFIAIFIMLFSGFFKPRKTIVVTMIPTNVLVEVGKVHRRSGRNPILPSTQSRTLEETYYFWQEVIMRSKSGSWIRQYAERKADIVKADLQKQVEGGL